MMSIQLYDPVAEANFLKKIPKFCRDCLLDKFGEQIFTEEEYVKDCITCERPFMPVSWKSDGCPLIITQICNSCVENATVCQFCGKDFISDKYYRKLISSNFSTHGKVHRGYRFPNNGFKDNSMEIDPMCFMSGTYPTNVLSCSLPILMTTGISGLPGSYKRRRERRPLETTVMGPPQPFPFETARVE